MIGKPTTSFATPIRSFAMSAVSFMVGQASFALITHKIFEASAEIIRPYVSICTATSKPNLMYQ